MHDHEFERLDFFQRIRSDAFKAISRRSMNQWRIVIGIRRGKRDDETCRYLERVYEYFSETTEGINDCHYHGVDLPQHADDIADWIQCAYTFDEIDAIRFRLNNYRYLRSKKHESNLARY